MTNEYTIKIRSPPDGKDRFRRITADEVVVFVGLRISYEAQ